MHRIVAALLRDFVSSYHIEEMDESEQFERLINYCVVAPEVVESFDLSDITTGSDDDGIDGVCVLIDQEVILSVEDADELLNDGRRNHDVKLVVTQSKTSESMDLGELLKFHAAIKRFCHDFQYSPTDPIEQNSKEIYSKAIDKAGSLKDGKLSLIIRYAYTGRFLSPKQIIKAIDELKEDIFNEGYFSDVSYEVLDRDGLAGAFKRTTSPIEAKIDAFSVAPLPKIADVEEAYLAVVPAKQFIQNMLADEHNHLRLHVFEENVRAFLGTDNPVNSAIGETIKNVDSFSRFPVLNNGITIVSPDVRVQGLSITFVDYQIVNGCQTSNVLWLNRNDLIDNMMITLKVIETDSEDVFSDLVKATNSQTKIDNDQFLSLLPAARKIERFFNSYTEDENRLYFERRDRQYVGQGVPGLKIFDLKLLARCVAAVYLERPDLSYRFPRKIFSDRSLSSVAFHEENREIIYYTSCLMLYKIAILFSNKQIPAEARKFKWHIMALLSHRLSSGKIPNLKSKKIEPWSKKIIGMIINDPKGFRDEILNCYEQYKELGYVSEDRLKRQAIFDSMKTKL